MFAAGCTSSKTATATPAPAAGTSAASSSAPAAGTPAPVSTPECPDKYGMGVWDYSWDTRYKPLISGFDIRDSTYGAEGSPDSQPNWAGLRV